MKFRHILIMHALIINAAHSLGAPVDPDRISLIGMSLPSGPSFVDQNQIQEHDQNQILEQFIHQLTQLTQSLQDPDNSKEYLTDILRLQLQNYDQNILERITQEIDYLNRAIAHYQCVSFQIHSQLPYGCVNRSGEIREILNAILLAFRHNEFDQLPQKFHESC